MSEIYGAADLVIARAGALTLAELQECLLPSLLIPFPYAAENHQMKNAIFFEEQGWAKVIEEKRISEVDLIGTVIEMDKNGQARKMKEKLAIDKGDKTPAVDRICNEILDMIAEQKQKTGKRQTNCAS